MRTTDALPPKLPRFTCERCGLTATNPVVRQVANPKTPAHGRCSNIAACDTRARRNKTLSKEKPSHA